MGKNCNQKISNTCDQGKNFAPCIEYQTTLPTFSKLNGCVNLDETTTELYSLAGQIKTQTDLSDLGKKCLTYALDSEGKIIVKNVLLKQEEKICELELKVKNLQEGDFLNQPIGTAITDFRCLALPCSNTIVTWKDLLKALTLKITCP